MKTTSDSVALQVRSRLVQTGGKITQDLGLGRIVGRVGVYLYLTEGERSLDDMARELGLSKAAVSIATRQLEQLGVLQRVSKPNDRRSYYRMVEHLGLALQTGLLSIVHSKMRLLEMDLAQAQRDLQTQKGGHADRRLQDRIDRARKSCIAAGGLLNFRLSARFSR